MSYTKKIVLSYVLFISFVVKADLLITPTRVVFNEGERIEEVILVNSSNEDRSYALSWSHLIQKAGGDYRQLSEAERGTFLSASEYIRFTPRRLTLEPGQNQRIKLMLRPTSDIKGKELRSHLKFTVIPNEVLEEPEPEQQVTEGISMKLNLFLNYTIPIIIKGHSKTPDISINNIQVQNALSSDNIADIAFSLNKTQPYSFFGDMTAYFKSDNSSEFVPVGYLNNLSMFHESERMNIIISWTEQVPLQNGELKIIYKGKSENTDTQIEEGIEIKV